MNAKRRLDKLEANAGAGGQHTLTIKYANDWREPPAEPVVMTAPHLTKDVTITIEYAEDWRHEQQEAPAD